MSQEQEKTDKYERLLDVTIAIGYRVQNLENLELDSRLRKLENEAASDEKVRVLKDEQEREEKLTIATLRDEHTTLKAQLRLLRFLMILVTFVFGLVWPLVKAFVIDKPKAPYTHSAPRHTKPDAR